MGKVVKIIFVVLFAASLGVNALLSLELDALLDADARRQKLMTEYRQARTPLERAIALSGLGVDLNALRNCPTPMPVDNSLNLYDEHLYRMQEQKALLQELRRDQMLNLRR